MSLFDWMFKKRDPWEYGHIKTTRARRHRKTGVCQFVLWKAGEQGHTEDYWHAFGYGHEVDFVPDTSEAP